MRVLLDPVHAVPALRTSAPAVRQKLRRALRRLAEDSSGISTGLDVKRLDAERQPIYRLRVGDWRVAFTVDKDIVVLRVFHRSQGYGWLADMD